MSWLEHVELFSRTSSASCCGSGDSNDNNRAPSGDQLNLTLYGAQLPLRRTRTIIHRATRGRTKRTLSLVPGLGSGGGGAAKLFAENTTLDLGFTLATNDDNDELDDLIVRRSGSVQLNNRHDSESSDNSSGDGATSTVESSPEHQAPPLDNQIYHYGTVSRSSTGASWTTDEFSTKSEHGSEQAAAKDDEFDSNRGEWNSFWKKYNHPAQSSIVDMPMMVQAHHDDADDTNDSSDCSSSRSSVYPRREKKPPQIQKVIMSTADAIEAATCARRLSEILSIAIRRSSLPCSTNPPERNKLINQKTRNQNQIPNPPPLPANDAASTSNDTKIVRSKSDSELPVVKITSSELQKRKSSLKPLGEDRIEIEIESSDPFNIASILQKVLIQRRDVIMPADESTTDGGCTTQRSDWSTFD